MERRTRACLLFLVGSSCAGRDDGVGAGRIEGICDDLCAALDTCEMGSAACPVDCRESFRDASKDDLEDCAEDLYSFDAGCDDFPVYLAASDACRRAMTPDDDPGVGGGGATGDACRWVGDGECDEPEGTGLCAEGTDDADCANGGGGGCNTYCSCSCSCGTATISATQGCLRDCGTECSDACSEMCGGW